MDDRLGAAAPANGPGPSNMGLKAVHFALFSMPRGAYTAALPFIRPGFCKE